MVNNLNVSTDILIYAFRYAIGRQTYAPLVIQETIQTNINNLETWVLVKMVDEINYTEKMGEVDTDSNINVFGDETNRKIWENIRAELEDEIKRRNNND